MKRTTIITTFLAMGLLVASTFAAAQDAAPTVRGGQVSFGLLGAPTVGSSKFQEYREVPKGASIPFASLFSTTSTLDVNLRAQNVWQEDQRYTGWANFSWLGMSFDYNQIPHNMGNDGHTLLSETVPGVWNMSGTLRKQLGDAVDAVATSGRNYPFYIGLLAPTLASANSVDLAGLRKRGDVEFDLGQKLPFDLAFTYMREVKAGTRGASGGDILGAVTTAVDVAEPMNEVVQDFGIRWAYNFKKGNVHANFNRNIYNNRQDSLIIDNPFRATDLAYSSASVPGGPGQVRFSTSPDNEASRGAFGVLLKFARQTRIAADAALGTWTQDAQFLPFTINTAIFTPAGVSATSPSALPQQSLGGKINTTMLNVSFSTRPLDGLGIRLRYRSYDMANKTAGIAWTGSTAGSPDRVWSAETPTADAPFGGFATANPYGAKTARFDARVSYDIKALTLEGNLRRAQLDRTYREATSGDENGYGLAAVFHAQDWLGFRGSVNRLKRTANGTTTLGFQADEAERETTRTGVDIEVTPSSKVAFTFAYFRRNDDYPNRPGRVPGNADTTVGLLGAKYDTYTIEFDVTPSERAELNAYYTYEKNTATNRWVTLTSGAINNQLRYDGTDKGNTFGANAVIHVVPEKWTFWVNAQHQKLNGLMDVTSNTTGSFYTGRATLAPPGPQDFTDYDDTRLTTFVAQIDRTIARTWTLSLGYTYEKYAFADAFSDGTSIFPQSVLFFLKANDGSYKANVAYTRLAYRF
jgi:hypothetical protein